MKQFLFTVVAISMFIFCKKVLLNETNSVEEPISIEYTNKNEKGLVVETPARDFMIFYTSDKDVSFGCDVHGNIAIFSPKEISVLTITLIGDTIKNTRCDSFKDYVEGIDSFYVYKYREAEFFDTNFVKKSLLVNNDGTVMCIDSIPNMSILHECARSRRPPITYRTIHVH